jgi:hypothetical protein
LSEEEHPEHRHHWSKVMCLTGVDYFSTLGYQPGIAALAAGTLAPLATVVLVLLTLFGAVPVYKRVAAESPYGQGSISMLEQLLPFWRGKVFVLVLLGFAATSWVITITLSAADATAHIVENPLVPHWFEGQEVWVTFALIAGLGVVFFRGFNEAIGVAVFIVVVYMGLNAIVIATSFSRVIADPSVVSDWTGDLTVQHGNPLMMIALALILFPKLALGMSGFETGVAVMTLVKGDEADTYDEPVGRIRNTKKLLVWAAVIMSAYLIASSLVTTWLIPAQDFKAGGEANGRALAYLAHEFLGEGFGTFYDASTVAILWFAGASAMAGLLNLVPQYLPRYGMAPEWAAATRPLVAVITAISCLVTWVFAASVDAQGGAYATGVLVLFTSASVAVTLAARKARQRRMTVAFALIALVMAYTTGVNVVERPDGVQIGTAFILAILAVSLVSRIRRAFELRSPVVEFDERAMLWVEDLSRRGIRIIAHEPETQDADVYRSKLDQIVADNDLPNPYDLIFLEVTVTDPSEFESRLEVRGITRHKKYRVLEVESPSVPNAIAAILLYIRDVSGVGNPLSNLAKVRLFGMGEVAPETREVLRRAERKRKERPRVHVG